MNGTIKILIVDDDADMLDVYSRLLESEGHNVLTSSNGSDCLQLARRERPDLIVMDVVLPDINGIELCRRIRTDPELAQIFIIQVSGHQTSSDHFAEGLEAGADGYLTKPIQFRQLVAQINALIRINEYVENTLKGRQEEEIGKLERLSSPSRAVTARLLGVLPLRESLPDVFGEIAESYADLLELSLQQRAYKVEYNISEGMHAIADRLGFLRAGPRDVVDIHLAALKKRSGDATSQKTKAYVEEGRVKVLELMGHLVSYYRNRSPGINLPAAESGRKDRIPARDTNP
ncbi:MAG TPA: response regulator [Blastocatellia bacterium]|nr:response regulator [Blastocatellia bacterium]